MQKKIQVVIADDNVFLGQALAENLNNSEQIEVINLIHEIDELIEYTAVNKFDILILDVNFNGLSSLDYVDKIKHGENNFKIIALTTLNNTYTKKLALDRGIDLFKGKDTAYDNFDKTIIDCYNIDKKKSKRRSSTFVIDDIKFTETKITMLKCLYHNSGKTEAEIADILNISTSSLKTHKRQLYEMTNTKKIVDLVKFGLANGILIQ